MVSYIRQRDLAQIDRQNRQLAASERRFRALIEYSSDAITLTDATGKPTYSSPTANRILGLTDSNINSPGDPFDSIHPDDRHQAVQMLAQVLDAPQQPITSEYRVRHADGSWRWIEVVAQNLLHEAAVEAIVVNFRDITDRKESSERIRRAAARAEALARTAARLNAQLDLDAVLQALCEETAQALDLPIVLLCLYDDKLDSFYLAADRGLPVGQRETFQLMPMQSLGGNFTSDSPVELFDAIELAQRPNAGIYARLSIKTMASIAMRREGQLIGLLLVAVSEAQRQFSDDAIALLRGLADQAAQAISNARLYEKAERRLSQVQSLRAIDAAITSSLDLRITLHVLLDQIASQLNVDAGAVMLMNPFAETLEFAAGRGFRRRIIEAARFRLGDSLIGDVVVERRTLMIENHLATHTLNPTLTQIVEQEKFVATCGTPLIAKGKVIGLLQVFQRTPFNVEPGWVDFLETLAGQAAIAVDNAELFRHLQQSNVELAMAYDTTLAGWSRALDLRDEETEGHSERVTDLSVQLAREMGVSDDELVHLRRGALLHDIGKMGVPDSVLLKPGPLTAAEWETMRQHPKYAYEMLSPITFLRHALDIPYCHHEKWDGSGYPRGLIGEQIPLAARIFAVADVWDALSSDRPYRTAWQESKITQYLREESGKHFDPQVVEAFLQMMENRAGYGGLPLPN